MSKNPIQQRLVTISSEIAATPPEELAFQHSVLTQCSLPVSQPPDGVLSWERQQGRARLLVEAGRRCTQRPAITCSWACPTGRKPGCC